MFASLTFKFTHFFRCAYLDELLIRHTCTDIIHDDSWIHIAGTSIHPLPSIPSIHTPIHPPIRSSIHASNSIQACERTCIHTHTNTHAHMWWIHTCICAWVHTRTLNVPIFRTWTHTCTHTHTHEVLQTYTWVNKHNWHADTMQANAGNVHLFLHISHSITHFIPFYFKLFLFMSCCLPSFTLSVAESFFHLFTHSFIARIPELIQSSNHAYYIFA